MESRLVEINIELRQWSYKMQFSLLSAVSIALALASQVVAKEQNGFINSCDGLSLASGHILFATCVDAAGTASQSSSVDLNNCVANIGGNLECTINGQYARSCSGCQLQDTDILSCNCGAGITLKDLNDCVSNTNGQLTCP
ncbi:hypothetical protein A0H81_02774 [Grifola frondosa]|uniref:Cyanovirin-N domain-containing protein n=1 Tax=Grifola frondosa TaxID=5627 RepID=A0A1C7MNB0_GRIFR|nr:hypothetical protein A0H81_02774 [Grifola frondosa]